MITMKPNQITLRSREGLDGGCWLTREVCDKCFNEIRKKASLALMFDPNTVEGALRDLSLKVASLDKDEKDEWSPDDFRVRE